MPGSICVIAFPVTQPVNSRAKKNNNNFKQYIHFHLSLMNVKNDLATVIAPKNKVIIENNIVQIQLFLFQQV